jgi:hypothetical protein
VNRGCSVERHPTVIKTRPIWQPRIKSSRSLFTGWTVTGSSAARAWHRLSCGTWEPGAPMPRERPKREAPVRVRVPTRSAGADFDNALGSAYVYRGEVYSSLSRIAREITANPLVRSSVLRSEEVDGPVRDLHPQILRRRSGTVVQLPRCSTRSLSDLDPEPTSGRLEGAAGPIR